MNYEQKYNKLVNAIKVLQETNPSDEGIQNWVNDNVPELRKSEDEKVRENIIHLVNAHGQGRFRESMLAWLEKQGQKPVWSEEDEKTVTGIINDIQERLEDYPTEQLADIYFKEIKFLKSLKDRVGCEANCTTMWKPSEEQIGVIEAVINNRSFQRWHLNSLYEQLKKLKGE